MSKPNVGLSSADILPSMLRVNHKHAMNMCSVEYLQQFQDRQPFVGGGGGRGAVIFSYEIYVRTLHAMYKKPCKRLQSLAVTTEDDDASLPFNCHA